MLLGQDASRPAPYARLGGLCLFRGTAPPAGRIEDARVLPDGRLLVTSDSGAGLYEPALRRWSAVTNAQVARLAVIGDHLVAVQGLNLRSVALEGVARLPSCDGSDVTIPWQTAEDFAALSLDESGGQVHLLSGGGRVSLWRDGAIRPVLPDATAGPDGAAWLRAWPMGEDIAVLTRDALWRYLVGPRTWQRVAMTRSPPAITEASLTALGPDTAEVTLWTDDGAYGATEGNGSLGFAAFTPPVWPRIATDPRAIADMAMQGGEVAILSRDQLELQTAAGAAVRVGLPPADRWFGRFGPAAARALVEGPADGPATAIDLLVGTPASGPLAAQAWRYVPGDDHGWIYAGESLWRIDRDLVLWACQGAAGRVVPQGCAVDTPAPLALASDDILGAVKQGEGYLVLRREGSGEALVRLDARLRDPARLGGLTAAAETRLLAGPGGTALVWDMPGGTLSAVEGQTVTPIASEVLGVLRTADGLYVVTPSGLSRLGRDGAVEPLAAGTVIDPRGRQVQSPLPGGPLPGSVQHNSAVLPRTMLNLTLPLGRNGAPTETVLMERSGRIDLYFQAPCQDPATLPPDAPDIDCLQLRRLTDLAPGERLVMLNRDGGRLDLRTTRRDLSVDPSSLAILRDRPADPYPVAATDEGDTRATLRAQISVVGGETWLAPPTIRQDRPDQAVLERGLREDRIAAAAPPTIWPAWAQNGIGWRRDGAAISIGAGGSAVVLSQGQAIRGGQVLPALPGRAAWLGDGTWAYLNPAGLWRFQPAGVSTNTNLH